MTPDDAITAMLGDHAGTVYLVDGELVMAYASPDHAYEGFCPRCGGPVTLRAGHTWRHDGPSCGWSLTWPLALGGGTEYDG